MGSNTHVIEVHEARTANSPKTALDDLKQQSPIWEMPRWQTTYFRISLALRFFYFAGVVRSLIGLSSL